MKDADGTEFTVLTEKKGKKEDFDDFYSNRKASYIDSSETLVGNTNTPAGVRNRNTDTFSGARTLNEDALSGANVENNSESAKLHKVFHGSGADFDAFDHSHMGEGEGAQAYVF